MYAGCIAHGYLKLHLMLTDNQLVRVIPNKKPSANPAAHRAPQRMLAERAIVGQRVQSGTDFRLQEGSELISATDMNLKLIRGRSKGRLRGAHL